MVRRPSSLTAEPSSAANARVSPRVRLAASGRAWAESARADTASSRTSRPRTPALARSKESMKSAGGSRGVIGLFGGRLGHGWRYMGGGDGFNRLPVGPLILLPQISDFNPRRGYTAVVFRFRWRGFFVIPPCAGGAQRRPRRFGPRARARTILHQSDAGAAGALERRDGDGGGGFQGLAPSVIARRSPGHPNLHAEHAEARRAPALSAHLRGSRARFRNRSPGLRRAMTV